MIIFIREIVFGLYLVILIVIVLTKAFIIYNLGVTILIISYAGLGSVIFISLDARDDTQYVETSVAASKPRQADVAYSLVRTRLFSFH